MINTFIKRIIFNGHALITSSVERVTEDTGRRSKPGLILAASFPFLLAVLIAGMFLLGIYGPASAQPNKAPGTACNGCHNYPADMGVGGTQEIFASINGVETASIAVSAGDTFEIDWVFEFMRGGTLSRGVCPAMGMPAGWVVAETTNTSNPSTIGGYSWNTVWDGAGLGWIDNGPAGDDADPDVFPASGNSWVRNFVGDANWENAKGSAFDDGSEPDGTADLMGGNARITVPGGTPDGTYYIYVAGVGHEPGGAKAMTWTTLTVIVSAAPDTTPPSVTSTIPADLATGVALDSSVTINWDENIDCATVNTTNITSTSPGWALSTCSGSQAVFTTSGQANSTSYSVNVTTAVQDLAGNPMSAAYPFSYTTEAGDVTPPSVSSTIPADLATGVALDSSVTINWDENIDCATVNTTNIASTSPGWALSTCSGSQAVFTTSGQSNSTSYSVNVTTAVQDLAGNPMSAAYPFSYTTTAGANTPPDLPTGIGQFLDSGGASPITQGTFAAQSTVYIRGTVADPVDGDTVTLEVEFKPLTVGFDGTVSCSSSSPVSSGSVATANCAPGDGEYKWRARAHDGTDPSGWVEF